MAYNNTDLAKSLITHDADVNAMNNHDDTPLIMISTRGTIEIVQQLITMGAKIHVKNKFGDTPVINACRGGNMEVLQLLIQLGANVNVKNNEGETPLNIVQNKIKEGAIDFGNNEPTNFVSIAIILRMNGAVEQQCCICQ